MPDDPIIRRAMDSKEESIFFLSDDLVIQEEDWDSCLYPFEFYNPRGIDGTRRIIVWKNNKKFEDSWIPICPSNHFCYTLLYHPVIQWMEIDGKITDSKI